jgi:hypothetical protein
LSSKTEESLFIKTLLIFWDYQSILKEDLGICPISAKLMSRLLREEQKNPVNMCQDIQERRGRDPKLL